jgi:hypothetical protein
MPISTVLVVARELARREAIGGIGILICAGYPRGP